MNVDPQLIWAIATTIVGLGIAAGVHKGKTVTSSSYLQGQLAAILAKIDLLQAQLATTTQQLGERVKGVEVHQQSLQEQFVELKALVTTMIRNS